MSDRVLRFLNSEILFKHCLTMQSELDLVFRFFSSHFETDGKLNGEAIATIEAYPYEKFNRELYAGAEFKDIVIRKSSAKAFNMDGQKALVGELEIIDSRGTGTALVLDSKNKSIQAYLTSDSHVQFVDFIRDIIIKHEERCGTLILHAAAAAVNHNGVVIVGDKGAGKSTFLLDLVGRQGYHFISGDKVFIRITDGVAMLYGWPEFPHLGYGTLQGHPVLIEELRKAGYTVQLDMQQKLLFTSDILKNAFRYSVDRDGVPLKHVIFPNVGAVTNETSLDPVVSTSRKRELLNHFEFSCHNRFAGYHSYITGVLPDEGQAMVNHFEPLLSTLGFYAAAGPNPVKSELVAVLA